MLTAFNGDKFMLHDIEVRLSASKSEFYKRSLVNLTINDDLIDYSEAQTINDWIISINDLVANVLEAMFGSIFYPDDDFTILNMENVLEEIAFANT